MTFCYQCGDKLEVKEPGISWKSPGCGLIIYSNPIPTVDAALFDERGKLLLGIRSREPAKGRLNLPGGFVDTHETLEQAIARELREELKLEPSDYGELTYAGSRVDFYKEKEKEEERQLLSFIFVGNIRHQELRLSNEVEGYVWKHPDELRPEELTTKAEYEHIMQAANLQK